MSVFCIIFSHARPLFPICRTPVLSSYISEYICGFFQAGQTAAARCSVCERERGAGGAIGWCVGKREGVSLRAAQSPTRASARRASPASRSTSSSASNMLATGVRYLVDCEPGCDEDVHVTHESQGKYQIALGMTSSPHVSKAQATQSRSKQVARTQSRWKSYGESNSVIITRKMKGPTCAAFLTFLAQIAPLCSYNLNLKF